MLELRLLVRRLRPLELRPLELRPLELRPLELRLLELLLLRLRGGTFAPRRRASESPMAMACSRLFTFFLERPERLTAASWCMNSGNVSGRDLTRDSRSGLCASVKISRSSGTVTRPLR